VFVLIRKKCNEFFDTFHVQNETTFNVRNFPQYKRLTEEDCKIVAHNRHMLYLWEGHICLYWASDSFSIIYLYEYLYKGAKRETLKLQNVDDINPEDELLLFVRGRKTCAMEVTWLNLGFQVYPKTIPSVVTIKVIDKQTMEKDQEEGRSNKLLQYFSRDKDVLQDLKYTDFHKLYSISKRKPIQKNTLYYENSMIIKEKL